MIQFSRKYHRTQDIVRESCQRYPGVPLIRVDMFSTVLVFQADDPRWHSYDMYEVSPVL